MGPFVDRLTAILEMAILRYFRSLFAMAPFRFGLSAPDSPYFRPVPKINIKCLGFFIEASFSIFFPDEDQHS
jgi:hypothetical protein